MKTTGLIKSALKLGVIFTFILFFTACEKNKDNQTFNDVFDISGVQNLNAKIQKPDALPALSEEFQKSDLLLAKKFEDITLSEMISHYEASIKLSSTEIDMLLKNDSKTYIDVINRFGSLPAQLKGLNENEINSVRSSSLNKYLVKVIAQPENFYSSDYYTAVKEYQNFIQNEIISPLKSATITVPPGNGSDPENATILYYKVITMNNNYDMWWTYWSDGTRTKHKGAAGSFPG